MNTALRMIAAWCALLALAVPCPCGDECTLPDVSAQIRAQQVAEADAPDEHRHSCCPGAAEDEEPDQTDEGCAHCADGGQFIGAASPELPPAVFAEVIPAPAVTPWPHALEAPEPAARLAARPRGPPPHASPPLASATPTFLRLQVIRC